MKSPQHLILFTFFSITFCSNAQETNKKKRSIFGEYNHGYTTSNFALGNLLHLGNQIDPFIVNEEHKLVNAYSSSIPYEQNIGHSLPHTNYGHYSFPITNIFSGYKQNHLPFSLKQNILIEAPKVSKFQPIFSDRPDIFGYNLDQEPQMLDSVRVVGPKIVVGPKNLGQNFESQIVALGSGSLGVTKLANGNLVLGSGSLGYTGRGEVTQSRFNINNNNNNQQQQQQPQQEQPQQQQNLLGFSNNIRDSSPLDVFNSPSIHFSPEQIFNNFQRSISS